MKTQPLRINIGCGQTPTPGWINFDNSLSLMLAKLPLAVGLLAKAKVLSPEQQSFINFAKTNDIWRANAARLIPLRDGSIEVIYTSHMIEHMDQAEARQFLKEAQRVMASGGIIRIVVPDLKLLADRYMAEGDADLFVEKTLLAQSRPKGLLGRLRYALIGHRKHLWMYDGPSLCKLLASARFLEPKIMEAGTTIISDPGELDLNERRSESVYVEATKP